MPLCIARSRKHRQDNCSPARATSLPYRFGTFLNVGLLLPLTVQQVLLSLIKVWRKRFPRPISSCVWTVERGALARESGQPADFDARTSLSVAWA